MPEERTEAADEIQMVVKTREPFKERAIAPVVDMAAFDGDDVAGQKDGGEGENDYDGAQISTGEDSPIGESPGDANRPSDGGASAPIYRPVSLKSQRVFSADGEAGTYVVSIETDTNGTGILNLNAIGEVGQEPVIIAKARMIGSDESIPIIGLGKLGPISFKAGCKCKFEVRLQGASRCAIGVALHAN